MPLAMQPKLLRALQSGEVQRVGSDRQHQVNVRIIAATNRDLAREVAAGRFRADLYHRLSVYPIEVPPLRARERDVLLLAGHFLEQARRRSGLPGVRLDESARQALQGYDWPGNVRELEHVISRAMLRAGAAASLDPQTSRTVNIDAALLELDSAAHATHSEHTAAVVESTSGQSLREATDDFQRRVIVATLKRHDGNQSRAARELGIDRGNFSRLLKRLGL